MLKQILLGVLVILLGGLGGAAFLFLFGGGGKKIVYVQTPIVFEQFKGKKELTTRLEQKKNAYQYSLDSLGNILKVYQNQEQTEPVQRQMQALQLEYQQKRARFEQEYQEQDAKYAEAVWKQINAYTEEYGKEKGYDYILGASGNGSLMYADGGDNITEDFVDYINARYEGN